MKWHSHKWVNIKEPVPDTFLGEKYTYDHVVFRVCRKCQRVQEVYRSAIGKPHWFDLNAGQTDIFFDKFAVQLAELNIARKEG